MDYDTLLKNFGELNEQIRLAKKEMQDKSKGLIEEAAKRFLDACPEVTGVHWTQYTPYFNDGESCEFSVNDFCYHILEDEDDEIEAYESTVIYSQNDLDKAIDSLKTAQEYSADPYKWRDKFLKEYQTKWNRPYGYNADKVKPYPSDPEDAQEKIDLILASMEKYNSDTVERIDREFNQFKSAMRHIPDDIMETVYGDHAMVVINRNGTEIDEYDHE